MGRLRLLFGTAIACWALIAMPALCAGGALLHPCDCSHSQDTDHQENEGCGHESECATDPCGTVVTRPGDGHELIFDLLSSGIVSAMPIFLVDQSVVTPIIWSSPPREIARASILDALTSTILLI